MGKILWRSSLLIVVLALAGCETPGGSGGETAGSATGPSSPNPSPFATCESLDSLPVGKVVTNGAPPVNSFQPPLMDIAAHPFTWSNGVSTSAGRATTMTGVKAGGSGVEVAVNNILLSLSVGAGQSLSGVRLAFGEYGGNINVVVNNTAKNFDNFSSVTGTSVGGVVINVTSGGLGNDSGVVEFTGAMPDQAAGLGQLAVGGQELWLDNICFDK